MPRSPRPHTPASPAAAPPTFRSGAVARLAGMPVSTLRIWEQRYRAVAPTTAPTGHRQYSAQDVDRVVLLRQLTGHGHAIGALAALGMEQLRELSRTHAAAAPTASEPPLPAALRIVVVGQAMARRLERPAVVQRWRQAPVVVAVRDSLAQAAQPTAQPGGPSADLLLWHAPTLHADALAELQAAQAAWGARHLAVAYRFAGAAARDAFVNGGASVVREPADDAALVAWLGSLALNVVPGEVDAAAERPQHTDPWSLQALELGLGGGTVPASRFDDATLTEFASLSSDVACECPSHVADLLMQIASFERYSASCASRNPEDVELHTSLQRVASAARILFETALQRVAAAEGLPLR
jgi:DNA-binding transcriptional MerR regulator